MYFVLIIRSCTYRKRKKKFGKKRHHVCQFSVKVDNFNFFDLSLGKLPNYVQYFGSNKVELQKAEWRDEMSWIEVDEAGWRWMEVGARFSNTLKQTAFSKPSVKFMLNAYYILLLL